VSRDLSNERTRQKTWTLVSAILFLSCYYVYLLLRIDPRLIYQSQEPVFFLDRYFISGFLRFPGGVNELISAFLSQFFYFSWTGAALLVLAFASITWAAKLFIESIRTDRPTLYLYWIPSILLLALHSNYRFPLVLTLGVLWILLGINIYISLAPSNGALRLLFFILLQATLYYVIGGPSFVFTVIIILYEVLCRRRIMLPVLYLIIAGSIPYIGASTVFLVHVPDAYMIHLTEYNKYKLTWLSWVLYAFFPLIVFLAAFEHKYVPMGRSANRLWGRLLYGHSTSARLVPAVMLFFLGVIAALFSFDREAKAFLRVERYARLGEWDKVLKTAQEGLPVNNIMQCQVNRALYHCGLLGDKLFSIAQLFGGNGLFMADNLRATFPLEHSDVFFDLGLVNESEHWAYEALVVNGDTPWTLQRIVLINLSKSNRDVARKYLAMLQRTLWHRSWAAEYQKYLSDTADLGAHPEFQYLQSVMPKSDFLVSPTQPELCLAELLKNTTNKMAFEYFMAYCLLEGQVGRFVEHLHRLDDFDYRRIPRHFEEAMLVYNQLAGGKGISLPGKEISQDTIRKFEDFNRIRAKYGGNKEAARAELTKYRDTYWFYGLYYYKPRE
jgi:hypothetical protein